MVSFETMSYSNILCHVFVLFYGHYIRDIVFVLSHLQHSVVLENVHLVFWGASAVFWHLLQVTHHKDLLLSIVCSQHVWEDDVHDVWVYNGNFKQPKHKLSSTTWHHVFQRNNSWSALSTPPMVWLYLWITSRFVFVSPLSLRNHTKIEGINVSFTYCDLRIPELITCTRCKILWTKVTRLISISSNICVRWITTD